MTTLFPVLAESFDLLARAAARLSDDDCRAPSRLPGWTRGHVLTHVARNADGLVNLLGWARTGEERPMYASPGARAGDIEAGAGRSARELLDDLEQSQARFDREAACLDAEHWAAQVALRGGVGVEAQMVPVLRLGEVVIHHTDLGTGYEPGDWAAPFVSAYLPWAARGVEERAQAAIRLRATDAEVAVGGSDPELVVSGPQAALLAWVVGRADGSELVADPARPLPDLGPWR